MDDQPKLQVMYTAFIHIYFTFLYTYTCLFTVIYFIMKYEDLEHGCYQMNRKLKHKELFKLWTQKEGEYRNIKSEYARNSDKWIERCCF